MVRQDTIDQRTRQRVLEASILLLAQGGLSGNLLKDAAALARCPLNRAEVFFRRDEDLVLALYARLAAELESRVEDLPKGDTATRFRAVMLKKLSLVAPYREALAALLAALLDPRHELGALSWLTIIGAFGVVITLGVLFWQREGGLLWMIALLPAVAACVYVTNSIWGLKRAIEGSDLADSIQTVKRAAKKVPLWVTVVAWSVLGAACALFYIAKE